MEPLEAVTATIVAEPVTPAVPQVVVEELLIEEISIDGMCGVY